MKCPFCGKEIKDDVLFCGFCGKQISRNPLKEAFPDSPDKSEPNKNNSAKTNIDSEKSEAEYSGDTVPVMQISEEKKSSTKPIKKHTSVKVLLLFLLIAFITAGVLGFLTVKGVIPLESINFTGFFDGETKPGESDDNSENIEDEKESIATTCFTSEQTDAAFSTETAESSEDASSEKTQPPPHSDEHYAKFVGDALVVVDDKAHIWSKTTINSILENAKAMSGLSDYSIMIVVTNDMFGMSSQKFADDYYDYVLISNEDNSKLIADGYIFLINLEDREYYLSTCGNAIDAYTDAALAELFGSIHQSMADGDYKAAVNTVIKNTIY